VRAKDGEKLQELDELYAALMQRQAVKIAHQQVAAIYPKVIEAGDSELLRVAAEPYKKLQDEVRPALIYATNELPSQAEIQFHLSDRGPDATAWPDAHSAPLLIEVTVASGKVRHAQMKALNETGVGHGFTDATDADTPEQIKARYDDCGAHSPDEICANLGAAIRLCMERKAEEKHLGRTLVILATQNIVLAEEWDRCMSEIRRTLPPSPCQAIFVVGYALGTGDVCHKLIDIRA
jgi:hypothetical protein